MNNVHSKCQWTIHACLKVTTKLALLIIGFNGCLIVTERQASVYYAPDQGTLGGGRGRVVFCWVLCHLGGMEAISSTDSENEAAATRKLPSHPICFSSTRNPLIIISTKRCSIPHPAQRWHGATTIRSYVDGLLLLSNLPMFIQPYRIYQPQNMVFFDFCFFCVKVKHFWRFSKFVKITITNWIKEIINFPII